MAISRRFYVGEEKVKLYLYSLSIQKEVGAGMTTFLLPKEALIKSDSAI